MVIKTFEEYLEQGIVKQITPDKQRAEHLIAESENKQRFLQEMIKALGVDDKNANEYIEYCYNIIIFLIRAEMLKKGFSSSGKGAHEAEVAFSRTLGMTRNEIQILDQLRYFRNGILYYGKKFDKEYAKKIIVFTENIKKRLKKINNS